LFSLYKKNAFLLNLSLNNSSNKIISSERNLSETKKYYQKNILCNKLKKQDILHFVPNNFFLIMINFEPNIELQFISI
jgi:hypothetical protein